MKTARTWLIYEQREPDPSKRTKEWLVRPMADRTQVLGEVRWHAPWRRYVFRPNARTLYDGECLRELSAFCARQTADRKAERALERFT